MKQIYIRLNNEIIPFQWNTAKERKAHVRKFRMIYKFTFPAEKIQMDGKTIHVFNVYEYTPIEKASAAFNARNKRVADKIKQRASRRRREAMIRTWRMK